MSEWIVQCNCCRATRPAEEFGITRFGAASAGKLTLAACKNCGGRLRTVSIRKRERPAKVH